MGGLTFAQIYFTGDKILFMQSHRFPPAAVLLIALTTYTVFAGEIDRTTIKVTASSWEQKAKGGWKDFPPEATLDGNLESPSFWCAEGKGEWIQYDLGAMKKLDQIKIAFVAGDKRVYTIDLLVSKTGDEKDWTTVTAKATSSGKTLQLEPFPLGGAEARFVKIIGYGNNSEKMANWTNLAEVAFVEVGPATEPVKKPSH